MGKYSILEKITIVLNFVVYFFLSGAVCLALLTFGNPNSFGYANAGGAPDSVKYPMIAVSIFVGLITAFFFTRRYLRRT